MGKRIRNTKEASIEKILEVAFLFYATRPYDRVLFDEVAKRANMSSGGIFYHFKTKNDLFIQMCDKYLFDETSIFLKLEKYENTSFLEYIDKYIKVLEEQKQIAKELGVDNLNTALINITNQAMYYYPDFTTNAGKWLNLQVEQWKILLNKAVAKGDIKENTDVKKAARLFEDIYRGISYASIMRENGIDLQVLKDSLIFFYNTLKV